MRLKIASSLLICAVSLSVTDSYAAAATNSASPCAFVGSAQIGGLTDWQNQDFGSNENLTAWWLSGFSEGAAGLECGLFYLQLDAAGYMFGGKHTGDFVPQNNDYEAFQSHIGGVIALKPNEDIALGLSASRIRQTTSFNSPDLGNFDEGASYMRVGAMGRVFIDETLALSGGAHLFKANDYFGNQFPHKGIEVEAAVNWYALPEFSLAASAAIMRSTFNEGEFSNDWNGYSAEAVAEYLFIDSPISAFAGGRYAHREIGFTVGNDSQYEDLQLFAGLRFDFSSTDASLLERDNKAPFNNTSVFLEKLPSYVASGATGGNRPF